MESHDVVIYLVVQSEGNIHPNFVVEKVLKWLRKIIYLWVEKMNKIK
jgi:hypothetical protein